MSKEFQKWSIGNGEEGYVVFRDGDWINHPDGRVPPRAGFTTIGEALAFIRHKFEPEPTPAERERIERKMPPFESEKEVERAWARGDKFTPEEVNQFLMRSRANAYPLASSKPTEDDAA